MSDHLPDVPPSAARIFIDGVGYVRDDLANKLYRALLLARTNGVGPYTPSTNKAVKEAIKAYESAK